MVSVAICTWNRAAVLRRTLAGLTCLDVPPGLTWELLVVNNNCSDDTDDVCRDFEDRLPLRLLHQPTPGQSHARNLAIDEARGTHIVWTDDDVLVDPAWLKVFVETFQTYKADWVFGRSEPEWPGTAPEWFSPKFAGYFALLDYGRTPFVVTDVDQPFYGLNFGGTRDAHLALAKFRVEFGFRGTEGGVGEDVDMFERAMKAGMTVAYTPDAVVRHIIPVDRVGKAYHRRRQMVALPIYYRHLGEMFPTVPWTLGLPRFFFSKALRDATEWGSAFFRGDQSERFYCELQLLRFWGLFREAVRTGFSTRPT